MITITRVLDDIINTNRYHWIGYSVAILVPVIGSALITSGKD